MAEHDLPITTALRAEFAAAGAQQCKDLGLDESTVAVWEDGFRTADDPHAFEWWYFDAQLDDGSNLVVVFSTKPHTSADGPLQPQVLVIHRTSDGRSGKQTLTYAPADLDALAGRDAHCDVSIGPNRVRGDLAAYDLHVEADDLVVDLRLERVGPSWRPSSGYNYFSKDHRKYLAWVVAVPYGTVTGTLTTSAGSTTITGSGYHDHNWGNTPMGDGIDHWYWGRARVGDYTLIYTQMTTKGVLGLGRLHLPVFYVARGERILTDDGLSLSLNTEGTVAGPQGQTYPTTLTWTWRRDADNDADGDPGEFGEITLTVTDVRLIEVLDMTADLPPWKRRLVHLTANPLYYDFDAHAELVVHHDGIDERAEGRTLFEKMMFR